MQRYFQAVADFVQKYMESTQRPELGVRRTAGFRWRHTLRVLAAAREIGKAEGANLDIVEMAALLHDVAKLDQRCDQVHHAVLGSEIARDFLHQLGLSPEMVDRIAEAVRYHSFDTHCDGLALETLVLKDADRLDEVGALGVIAAAVRAGRQDMDYRHCLAYGLEDLQNLKAVPFYTASGRKIFAQRLRFMASFWEQARAELAGEKIFSGKNAPDGA
ncbi:MAG: HD domain-containing protein [Firmicutes bacterium]|nr:HD domain-containing protein [Bacillota bacterium]HOB34197.1 HD domain-containing protein [Bacillota bacterium]HPZ90191.1 HD domain-containing protein [Bacillota bacterium]HQE01581.1 HD domain-containing protein [Bacillota bacterium]